MTKNIINNTNHTDSPQIGEKPLGAAELTLLHKLSSHHREAVLGSDTCGCFYCGSIFPAAEISKWVIEPGFGDVTALCPHCEIDAVLPSSTVEKAGFTLSSEMLSQMEEHWFSPV